MTSPKEILQSRGIYEEAVKLGWTEGKSGWEIPIFNLEGQEIARRSKAYDSKARFKYAWIPSKPDNPESDYYVPKSTKEAIREAGGVAFLANGEASVLAMKAAGIHNVFATCHGETTIPKGFVTECELLGISKLINIADKDKTGIAGAAKMRDSLRDSGIEYQPKQWPDYLPDKSDFNDLYIHLAFDKEAVAIALEECQALILPQPEVKKLVTLSHDDKLSEGRKNLIAGIHQELQTRNSFTGKIRHSVWAECICPFHADTEPSAGFNIESGVLNCMAGCGALSPYEVAKRLGLDWKAYYPKSEGKRKPLKPDLARFQESLEQTPILLDNRTYEDVLRDEAQARIMAFDAKQFVSWWNGKMPLSTLSAIMTLANGRSSLALFLGRLDIALASGKLPSVASIEQIMEAVCMGRKTVNRNLLEAEHMGFCTFLRTLSTIDIYGKETPQNGRPLSFYMLELSISDIQSRLKKMLEIYYIEKHINKAIAQPTFNMALQLGLGETEYRAWWDKAKQALEDKTNKAAKQALDVEMFGNGTTWKGWEAALDSAFSIPLNFFAYEDCQDLRVAIARHWVTNIRACNSREELARLLGCTDPVIDKVLDKANLLSMKQTERVEFPAPKSVAAMAFEFGKVQRDLRGKCWKISFWIEGEMAWGAADEKTYLNIFAQQAGRISKVFMLVTTPSIQRAMTEDEIKARDERRALEALQENLENGTNQAIPAIADTSPNVDKQASIEAPKRSYTYQKWDKHSYAWLYRQLQLLIHCFTPYKLEQHTIVDKQGKGVASGQLPDLIKWFVVNAGDKQKRKVASFYGKDYDENADIAALQALADERLAALGRSESIQLEDIEELHTRKMDLYAEAPKQAPRFLTQNKPVYDTSKDIADMVRIFNGG